MRRAKQQPGWPAHLRTPHAERAPHGVASLPGGRLLASRPAGRRHALLLNDQPTPSPHSPTLTAHSFPRPPASPSTVYPFTQPVRHHAPVDRSSVHRRRCHAALRSSEHAAIATGARGAERVYVRHSEQLPTLLVRPISG